MCHAYFVPSLLGSGLGTVAYEISHYALKLSSKIMFTLFVGTKKIFGTNAGCLGGDTESRDKFSNEKGVVPL